MTYAPAHENQMKRLALAATFLLLTGCGSGEAPATKAPATQAERRAQVPREVRLGFFRDEVRKDVPALSDRTDSNIDAAGGAVCDMLVAGEASSWVQALKVLLDEGVPARQAGAFIGASASALCPEKTSALPSQP